MGPGTDTLSQLCKYLKPKLENYHESHLSASGLDLGFIM